MNTFIFLVFILHNTSHTYKYMQKHISSLVMHLLPDRNMLFSRESDRESARALKLAVFSKWQNIYTCMKHMLPLGWGYTVLKKSVQFSAWNSKQSAVQNYAVQSLIPKQSLLILHIYTSVLSPVFNYHTSSSKN